MTQDKCRRVIAAQEKGPGPGRYALPTTCGFQNHDFTKLVQPAYSLSSRINHSKVWKDSSPGPTYFINSRITRYGRDGTPSYSLLGRQSLDMNSFLTPSPGAYCPEKVHPQGERHAPCCSMGARTRFRQKDKIPASNRYDLPPLVGARQASKQSSPSYSMTCRAKVGSFAEDLCKTPGPGRYNGVEPNIVKSRAPMYSMLGRSFMPGDKTTKPGPGAYKPERVFINKPEPAKYSLGIRHSEFVTPLIILVKD